MGFGGRKLGCFPLMCDVTPADISGKQHRVPQLIKFSTVSFLSKDRKQQIRCNFITSESLHCVFYVGIIVSCSFVY